MAVDRAARDAKIRELAAKGRPQWAIAADFGLSEARVSQIINPERYAASRQRQEEQHPDEIRAYKRRWKAAHPDHDRSYYLTHREQARARQAARYAANRERIRAQNHERYEAHREEYLERATAYGAAIQAETLERAANYGKQWTGPELEIAARTDMTIKDIALKLGRSYAAVKAMREKVRRDPRKVFLAGLREVS